MDEETTSATGIPVDWDEVSPAWMTAALSRAFPGVEVAAVELVLRDDGTNRRARFGLTHAGAPGPETVFLKAADPAHAKLNAATGGLFNEPRFFNTDVELPLEHPRVHLARYDEPTLDFVLVMEDVTARGADPRDSTRPMTIDQAADGVRGLARLHRAFWGGRLTANAELDWVGPFVAWRGMHAGITIGLERAGDTIPGEVQALTGPQIEDDWTRFIATVDAGPHTLLHGDPHIGNTYVLPDDTVGFLDWQVLRRGHQSLDLGYFLQGAVTIEDRRASKPISSTSTTRLLRFRPTSSRPATSSGSATGRRSPTASPSGWRPRRQTPGSGPRCPSRSRSATPPRTSISTRPRRWRSSRPADGYKIGTCGGRTPVSGWWRPTTPRGTVGRQGPVHRS